MYEFTIQTGPSHKAPGNFALEVVSLAFPSLLNYTAGKNFKIRCREKPFYTQFSIQPISVVQKFVTSSLKFFSQIASAIQPTNCRKPQLQKLVLNV
tara:strand:- start:589 stop:876 length:288 start_codon:yes stop_codon:yes gene_type:complete